MPDGKKKTDEFFGDVEVYYDGLAATVPVTRPAGASSLEIEVSYQGCADAGLCYPPVTKTLKVDLPRPARRRQATPRRWSPNRIACAKLLATRQPARDPRQFLLSRSDWPRIHALRAADDSDPFRHRRRARAKT